MSVLFCLSHHHKMVSATLNSIVFWSSRFVLINKIELHCEKIVRKLKLNHINENTKWIFHPSLIIRKKLQDHVRPLLFLLLNLIPGHTFLSCHLLNLRHVLFKVPEWEFRWWSVNLRIYHGLKFTEMKQKMIRSSQQNCFEGF